MSHSQNIAFPNAMLLLMAMLDDRREPQDVAVHRRTVIGALRSWAYGEAPAQTAVEQAFADVQKILERFLASRSGDDATPVTVKVVELAQPAQIARLIAVSPALNATDLSNQLRETVTSVSGARS